MFMQILFKRFGDAGMKDTLIQSSVIPEGSIKSVLRGKCYNRGIRLYKILYEALLRQMMSHVIEKVNQSEVEKLKQELSKYNVFTNDLCKNIKDNVQFEKVLNVFIDLKSENLRSVWLRCLEMTEILLNSIYAVRSGSWHLLLECIREILPHCFAYDHINYARYLTYFLGDML